MTAPLFTAGGNCRALMGLEPDAAQSRRSGTPAGSRRAGADRPAPAPLRSTLPVGAGVIALFVCLLLGFVG